MKRPEQKLHRVCVEWFRWNYPNALGFHCPNGGYRTPVEAGIFKSLGVIAGVPDFLIFDNGGLAVEFKADKGRCTEAQQAVQGQLRARGWRVEVVRDVDAFCAVVNEYLRGAA